MSLCMQDQLESHDMHEGVAGNGSLSTCSSLPASEDAYALAEGYDGEGPGRHGNSAAFPSISEGRSPGIERPEPASHEAQWQRMAFAASEWAEKRNGTAPLPPLQNGNFSAAASPERQASPGRVAARARARAARQPLRGAAQRNGRAAPSARTRGSCLGWRPATALRTSWQPSRRSWTAAPGSLRRPPPAAVRRLAHSLADLLAGMRLGSLRVHHVVCITCLLKCASQHCVIAISVPCNR